MDDGGNLIYYLILGAIYLLSRMFGKKKKQPAKPVRRPENRHSPEEEYDAVEAPTAEKEPALSFEEILRELSGVPQPKPQADPSPRHEAEAMPSMEALKPEAGYKPAPLIEGRQQPAYAIDEMDQIATEFKVPKAFGSDRLSEPDLAASRRKDLSFKRDDKYRIKVKEDFDYLSIFREENGAAKAFVMGEIFNRRY